MSPRGADRAGKPPIRKVSRKIQNLFRSKPVAIVLYLIVIYLIARVSVIGAEAMGYNWQWYRVPDYLYTLTEDGFQWGEIVFGLVTSLDLSVKAFVLAPACWSVPESPSSISSSSGTYRCWFSCT